MKNSIALLLYFYVLSSCSQKYRQAEGDYIIANGQMPALANDKKNNLHLVYFILIPSFPKGESFLSMILFVAACANTDLITTR